MCFHCLHHLQMVLWLVFLKFVALELVWDGRLHLLPERALAMLLKVDPASILDDADLFALYVELRARRCVLRAPLISLPGRFSLDEFSDAACKALFRFERNAIRVICQAFWGAGGSTSERRFRTSPPEESHGYLYSPEEGFCILCWRLASPAKLAEGMDHFRGRKISALSTICNDMAIRVGLISKQCLSGIYRSEIIACYDEWRAAITEAADGYDMGVYGLIDGKLYEVAHWTAMDGPLYSQYYKRPGLKFLTVTAPNGLAVSIHGPECGRHHDSYCLQRSGWVGDLMALDNHFRLRNHQRTGSASIGGSILGDSAFPRFRGMASMYKKNELTNQARIDMVSHLKSVRGEVEHFFCLVVMNWRHLSNLLDLKLQSRPVTAYIWTANLLTNLLTCANGSNQISDQFGLHPPGLREYLNYLHVRHNGDEYGQ